MKIITNRQYNYSSKTDAFPYQAQAFDAIKDLDYAAILHEQGLGKTKIAVDLMLYWLKEKSLDTVLVVTKKQLVANWVNELANHIYLRPKVLSSDKTKNFYIYNSIVKVVIANFETISTDKDRIKLFLKSRDVGIIIDESTKLKNPDSKLTKDFFEISSLFKTRVIMTGTPVANRPYDIWAQIYFLDQGKSLGTDFKVFKKNTDLRNSFARDSAASEIFENEVADIYEKIRMFSVRETKKTAGIVLPSKIYENREIDMRSMQEEMYRQLLVELKLEVTRDGAKVLDNNEEALKRLLRLIQIASNPNLVDENYREVSCKQEALTEMLESIMAKGDKCIVWSSFIDNVDNFAKYFAAYHPRKIHGKMAIEDRNRSVELFKNDAECKVLFATPQAAKEGLTLTVANHVIFYDRGFNLDDYLQAQDRIHRISQKKECYIYNLIARGTVDEWVDQLLYAKQQAAFLAQGDISKEQYSEVADYSYGEMIQNILAGQEI